MQWPLAIVKEIDNADMSESTQDTHALNERSWYRCGHRRTCPKVIHGDNADESSPGWSASIHLHEAIERTTRAGLRLIVNPVRSGAPSRSNPAMAVAIARLSGPLSLPPPARSAKRSFDVSASQFVSISMQGSRLRGANCPAVAEMDGQGHSFGDRALRPVGPGNRSPNMKISDDGEGREAST
jgi:hypothetical protein